MRRLKKVVKFLVVLVLAMALVSGIFDVILGRRVERQLLAIKAAGEPVAMTELALPKVPDSENGAIIYTEVIKRFRGIVLNPKGGAPLVSPKHSDDLDPLDRLTDRSERLSDPKVWDEARPVILKYRPLIPLIEQAASKPECQFPVNWEAGLGALYPYYSPMRSIVRFLHANALLEAREGNMDAALRSVELGFKVSRSLRHETILIGGLVRTAAVAISCHSLRDILEFGNISEAQARQLDATLSQDGMLPDFDRAMMGERCCGLWMFQWIRKDPGALQSMASDTDTGMSPTKRSLLRAVAVVWRPVSYADELCYLRMMNLQIETLGRPYREVHNDPALTDPTAHLPRYALLSRIISPVFAMATSRRDSEIADIGGSRILLGLIAYKDRYGYYPADLKTLHSQLGWTVPTDPFSAKDFIYKPQGNGFLLYSIGDNLKDDGGKVLPKGSMPGQGAHIYKNQKDESVADIVWEMDH